MHSDFDGIWIFDPALAMLLHPGGRVEARLTVCELQVQVLLQDGEGVPGDLGKSPLDHLLAKVRQEVVAGQQVDPVRLL